MKNFRQFDPRPTIVFILAIAFAQPAAAQLQIFLTDFNSGVPGQFSGITGTTSVLGYAGLGTGANTFDGLFLRNANGGNPASPTTLTLTGLPSHSSIDLNFLLAIIDSWDGNGNRDPGNAPDFFNVTMDGNTIFSDTFEFRSAAAQDYIPPAGVALNSRAFTDLGFSIGEDAGYNMGLDPTFDGIPHSSSTVVIDWFASGGGWLGGVDESWAIDNVAVILNNQPPDCNGVVPSVAKIWPPNHKFVGVNIEGITDPEGDPVTITITGITQDEALDDTADGNFEPDGAGVGTSTAQVRAERSGNGNGRVYEISFTASDGMGECSSSVQVCVPHDKKDDCVDDGQIFNSVTSGAPKLIFTADDLVEKATLPDGYVLLQNHPNPFNPSTTITFAVPEAGEVTLAIYNLRGRQIQTLVAGTVTAGRHTVVWDGTDSRGAKVASGIYVYKLRAKDFVATRKLVFTK